MSAQVELAGELNQNESRVYSHRLSWRDLLLVILTRRVILWNRRTGLWGNLTISFSDTLTPETRGYKLLPKCYIL